MRWTDYAAIHFCLVAFVSFRRQECAKSCGRNLPQQSAIAQTDRVSTPHLSPDMRKRSYGRHTLPLSVSDING
jgi:hypothetical protein